MALDDGDDTFFQDVVPSPGALPLLGGDVGANGSSRHCRTRGVVRDLHSGLCRGRLGRTVARALVAPTHSRPEIHPPLDPARLHVSADWYIFEPVDRNYRLVLRGEPSHTVLMTNLANRVQPLIRYDQGDSVTLRPDACPCGSPLPAIRVVGRTKTPSPSKPIMQER